MHLLFSVLFERFLLDFLFVSFSYGHFKIVPTLHLFRSNLLILFVGLPFVSAETQVAFQLGQSLLAIAAQKELPPEPLDTSGLDTGLQKILHAYYEKSLGGKVNWGNTDTLRIKGSIRLNSGETLQFKNYRKKPDLNKTILYLPEDHEIIQAYNGTTAWEWFTFESPDPKELSTEQSIDFIRDACFGSHLLYPRLPGKVMAYLATELIDGKSVHKLRVSLPNGQVVLFGINAQGYQIFEETESTVDGSLRRTLQSDFKIISGVAIPFTSQTFVDGELIQEVSIESAEFNTGVYTWMFSM